MAPIAPFYAYKETRLNLDPTTPGSTVVIRLPTSSTSTWPLKSPQKRSQTTEGPVAEDESGFRQRHLATAASIYYRQYHTSPGSFLWRVLEGGKVLSICAVDISRHTAAADATLTLRLAFPSPIRSGCVAFADSEQHDVLNAYVLLETNQLYTLSLRPDFFRKTSSTDDNVADWCKIILPTAYATKQIPHRLAALSADEVLIANYDGGLTRLVKHSGGDGSEWTQMQHSEGGLNFRSIIPWAASTGTKIGNNHIAFSTATSIAASNANINGSPYAFMISLDHKLRIWNLRANKLAFIVDILNQAVDLNSATKRFIDPSNSQLVKVYENKDDDTALCITYSPGGAGEFKFWKAKGAMDGDLEVADLFTHNNLRPQPPTSNAVWTLADFAVVEQPGSIPTYTVWTLWKNNTSYEINKLEFQVGSTSKVKHAWLEDWTTMAKESSRDKPGPNLLPGDCADGTDKWLEYILTPGRYTSATIETSLIIYAHGLGLSKDVSRKSGSLAERMCATIASIAALGRTSDAQMDYEQFRSTTDAQWRRFNRLLMELDKQRGEALSISIDPQGRLPWVVLADGAAAVRECSNLEKIWHNLQNAPAEAEHITSLVTAAATLRESASAQMRHNFCSAVLKELFEAPSLIDTVRMKIIYDKCDFANKIGDEEYEQLQANLGGHFKDVTPQVYAALFRLMVTPEDSNMRQNLLPLTAFGNKLVVEGVQETVELHRNVCLDQLFLLILIEAEINHGEDGIGFDSAKVFDDLITTLGRLELINWLATTEINLHLPKERSNSIGNKTSSLVKKPAPNFETVTTLEGILRHLFAHDTKREEPMSSILTETILQVCDPDSKYELVPSVAQCFLLRHGRPDLAIEFSRFTLSHPFDVYIQGRAHLAASDALSAAALFKKAAFGIGVPDPKKQADFRSGGYLDATERNLMNAGLPEYYSHIVALYEKEKIYSYVIDFARLALQFIRPGDAHVEQNQLRTEMHSRLFNAAIQTSRYDLAHSSLILLTDSALQHSSLRTLVTKMCEASRASELIALPLIGLQDAVDELLAQKCQNIFDVTIGVPYHKILYAWRIKRNDFRGAAAISLERLQRLQQSEDGDRALRGDGLETPVTQQYVVLINALSCVDPKQAWVLSEEAPPKLPAGVKVVPPKRKVVTLEEIRRLYQEELDRIAAIENNQFPFGGGDDMKVDVL